MTTNSVRGINGRNGHCVPEAIGIKKPAIWDSVSTNLDYIPYEASFSAEVLTIKYIQDYYSSVWISKEPNFREFSDKYAVVSGGWYGPARGGRWRARKRGYGVLQFIGAKNLIQEPSSGKARLVLNKPLFRNHFEVEMASDKVGVWKFKCFEIQSIPSDQVHLFNNVTNEYEDKTEILEEGGMRLRE